jgi:hypothetical protein
VEDGFKLFRVTEWLLVASAGCDAINPWLLSAPYSTRLLDAPLVCQVMTALLEVIPDTVTSLTTSGTVAVMFVPLPDAKTAAAGRTA